MNQSVHSINAISIHIRLTDYTMVYKKELKFYSNLSNGAKEYLNNAIDYMSQKYEVHL